MSFAIWFILLGAVSVGIGSFIGPWMESSLFRLLWAPGVLVSGACRYVGARAAGLPVSQVKLLSGEGRGVRVDISGANALKVLVLSLFSYVGPLVIFLFVNHGMGQPLRLEQQLPLLSLDSSDVVVLGNQVGRYLYEIWHVLSQDVVQNPFAIILLYVFLGILLSNPPGKGEFVPLLGFVLMIGAVHLLGVTLQKGSTTGTIAETILRGLSLTLGYALLALLVAGVFAAIHRARQGHDSGKAR